MKIVFLILAWIVYAGGAYFGVTKWIIPTQTFWTKITYSAILAVVLGLLIYATVAHASP